MWHYKSCGCILWTVLNLGLCVTGKSKRAAIPSSSLNDNVDGDLESRSRSRIQKTNASGTANAPTPRKFSEETPCDEQEYTDNYMCDGMAMTYTCIDPFGPTKKNFTSAKSTCEENNMVLIKLADLTDKVEYASHALPETSEWIGLYKDDDNVFRWLKDGTEAIWSDWEDIQPDDTGRCVESRFKTNWNDNYCDVERYFFCGGLTESGRARDYRVKPLEMIIDPSGTEYLSIPLDIKVTCIAYLYRFEALKIRIDFEFDPPVEYAPESDCTAISCRKNFNQSYIRNSNGLCVRKTVFELTVPMSNEIDGAQFQCRKWNHTAYADSAKAQGPYNPQADQKPELIASIDPNGLAEGYALRFHCSYVLGTSQFVSMALISAYSCGDYMMTFGVHDDRRVKYQTTYDCLTILGVEITPRSRDDKHTRVEIMAQLLINNDLESAVIACYAYNASFLMEERNFFRPSDNLTAKSVPIKVIRQRPRILFLEVYYHAEPPLVYNNYRLTALCDANVGEGGSLLWTLRTHGGDSQFASDYNQTNPDISVYSHPSGNSSCPHGWTRNLALETCVKILDDPYSWEESRRQCQSIGSDLAQVFSPDGLSFLTSILGADGYWIGLHDMNGNGKFTWWSNEANEIKFHSNSWVTLEVREKKPLVPDCVFIHNKKWYTHGCIYKLRPVCETQPQHGIPLDGGFSDLLIGKKMRSMMTIKINKSLEGATLECEIVSPTLSGDNPFIDSSMPLSIIYGPADPRYETRWEMKDNKVIAHIECSALVGTDGSLSVAVFSAMKIKYLYVAALNKTIQKVQPAPDFSLSKLTVTKSKFVGPEIALEATLSTTEELETPFVTCYSHRVRLDETFTFDTAMLKAKNTEITPLSYNVELLLLLAIAVLLLLIVVTTVFTTKAKAKIKTYTKRKTKMTPIKQQKIQDEGPALQPIEDEYHEEDDSDDDDEDSGNEIEQSEDQHHEDDD